MKKKIGQNKKKRSLKKIALITVITLTLLYTLGGGAVSYLVYSQTFGRVGYSQDRTGFVPNLDYSGIDQSKYPREEFTFTVDGNKLTGYEYGKDKSRGLIVISSGLGGTGDDYMTLVTRFIDDGYCVITYDNTGVAGSEGNNTRGLAQSAIDLDALLTHIESQQRYDHLPLYLLGHSWGGYGVCAALSHPHRVKAAVSMAAYNDPVESFNELGSQNVGSAFYLFYPHMWLLQRGYFGAAMEVKAVDAINANDIPFLIIQGKNDDLVTMNVAIYGCQDQITNEKAQFLLTEGDHEWVYCSKEALEYQNQLAESRKEYRDKYPQGDEDYDTYIAKWVDSNNLDIEFYNQVDEAIILRIENLFDSAK